MHQSPNNLHWQTADFIWVLLCFPYFCFSFEVDHFSLCSKMDLFSFFFFLNILLNDQFLNTSQYGKTYCPSLATTNTCLDPSPSALMEIGWICSPYHTAFIWNPLFIVPLGLADPVLSCWLPLLFPVYFPPSPPPFLLPLSCPSFPSQRKLCCLDCSRTSESMWPSFAPQSVQ